MNQQRLQQAQAKRDAYAYMALGELTALRRDESMPQHLRDTARFYEEAWRAICAEVNAAMIEDVAAPAEVKA